MAVPFDDDVGDDDNDDGCRGDTAHENVRIVAVSTMLDSVHSARAVLLVRRFAVFGLFC